MPMKAFVRSWRSVSRGGQGNSAGANILAYITCETMDYEITPEEVKAKLDAGEAFTLLDVREPWEFEAARTNAPKLMPMGDVPSRAHKELDPEDHIVVQQRERLPRVQLALNFFG